jgi:hypothetical protein
MPCISIIPLFSQKVVLLGEVSTLFSIIRLCLHLQNEELPWFALFAKYFRYEVEEDEVGGACAKNGGEEERV